MKRVCAWCRAELGAVEGDLRPEGGITHGICEVCEQRLMAGGSSTTEGRSLQEFLDHLGVPILLFDPEPQVRTANVHARALLGKDLPEIEARRGGDVIECIHARHPQGCGNTVHCRACTLRNTVIDTLKTGKSFLRVPAYRDIETADGAQAVRFLISTEKAGRCVLLRIDEVGEAGPGRGLGNTPSGAVGAH